MATAQRILVVNTNNDYNNAKIFANGSLQTWNGGGIAEVVNLRKFMTPAPGDTLLGKGLIITYFRDNDW